MYDNVIVSSSASPSTKTFRNHFARLDQTRPIVLRPVSKAGVAAQNSMSDAEFKKILDRIEPGMAEKTRI